MVAAFYFILSMYILSFSKQVSSVCYEPGIMYGTQPCSGFQKNPGQML